MLVNIFYINSRLGEYDMNMVLLDMMMIKIISPRFYTVVKVTQGICSFTAFMGHKIETVE